MLNTMKYGKAHYIIVLLCFWLVTFVVVINFSVKHRPLRTYYKLYRKERNMEDKEQNFTHGMKTNLQSPGITMCEQCGTIQPEVPNMIYQYGRPRTGSTLQFQILCVIMAILHEDEIGSLNCYFDTPKKEILSKYQVMKTHNIYWHIQSLRLGSWIFMTTRDVYPSEQLKLRKHNIKVHYTVDLQTVSKEADLIVYKYKSIFGLTDEQIKHVAEYIGYWDILRLCCGIQMSKSWRKYISSGYDAGGTGVKHVNNETLSPCKKHAIGKIERLLMRTYIFQRFANITSLRDVIGKVSNVDGEIDGRYCERCNNNIARQHLEFNQKCI